MTYRQIIYTPEVIEKMQRRDVRRWQVRIVMERGIPQQAETRGGEQRWIRAAMFGGQELRVVYLHRADHDLLISVQWKRRAAKRRRLEGE